MFYWNDDWSIGERVEYFDPDKFQFKSRKLGAGQPAIIVEVFDRDLYSKIKNVIIGLLKPTGEVGKKLTVSDEHIKLVGRCHVLDVDNEDPTSVRAVQGGDIIFFSKPSKKKGLFKSGCRYRCIETGDDYIIIKAGEERVKITHTPYIEESIL